MFLERVTCGLRWTNIVTKLLPDKPSEQELALECPWDSPRVGEETKAVINKICQYAPTLFFPHGLGAAMYQRYIGVVVCMSCCLFVSPSLQEALIANHVPERAIIDRCVTVASTAGTAATLWCLMFCSE